jgi:hypothetical protein
VPENPAPALQPPTLLKRRRSNHTSSSQCLFGQPGEVETQLESSGFTIIEETHALSHEGARYFGVNQEPTSAPLSGFSFPLSAFSSTLAPREDGHLDVRFAQVSLGILDPNKIEFTPAIPH